MPSGLRAYLELLRLPAVFTAMADVLMGAYVAAWSSEVLPDMFVRTLVVPLLVAGSSCLYLSGMVLNDYFDRMQDAVERPKRPIPSGRVTARAAAALGAGLLCCGVVLVCLAAYHFGSWFPALVGATLAGCVLLYDSLLKRTPLGPLAMGACRSLNVLLGMSVAAGPWIAPHYWIALGLGLFVAGLTIAARTEARQSRRGLLILGLLLMWLGMASLASFPYTGGPPTGFSDRSRIWLIAWLLLGLQVGVRSLRAILDPSPAPVQAAVRQGILSLVVFDAVITFAVAGPGSALVVLALLVPTILLGQWLQIT